MANRYDDNDEHQRYLDRLKKIEGRRHTDSKKISVREANLNHVVPAVGHKQKIGNGKRVVSILLPLIVILLAAAYTISPLSKINSVTVVGNSELTAKQVKNASGLQHGKFIWWKYRHQQATLHQAQKKNPQIKSMRIKLTGFRSIRVSVSEYPIIGIINHHGKQELLFSNGKYRPMSGKVNNFLHYSNFSHNYTHLKIAAREIGKLSPDIRAGISNVRYSPTKVNPDRLKLLMNDGNTVLVRADTLSSKMKYYPSIISQMQGNGVIDLQYGAYSYDYGTNQK